MKSTWVMKGSDNELGTEQLSDTWRNYEEKYRRPFCMFYAEGNYVWNVVTLFLSLWLSWKSELEDAVLLVLS